MMQLSSTYNLAAINPELAKQWHPTKNGELKPENFTPKSGKKVWWQCQDDLSHAWEASIAHRSNGRSCPFCSNKKVDATNNLAKTHPELLEEFHPTKNKIIPEQLSAGSTRRVWWQCKKSPDHVWQTVVHSRTRKKPTGCPFCSNQSSAPELRLYAEFLAIFPEVKNREKVNKQEIDIYLPDVKIGVEYDGFRYHASKEESDTRKNKTLRDAGVTIIRIREKPLKKINAEDILVSSNDLLKTDVDELLRASVFRNSKFDECITSYIEQKKFINDEKYRYFISFLPNPIPEHSLKENNPSLCKEWDYEANSPLIPENFTVSSGKKVAWVCNENLNHKWKATIASRNRGSGCPFCRNLVVSEENNLATVNPKVASEWHYEKNGGLEPNQVVAGSAKEVWWKCGCGTDHEWKASIVTRNHGTGCPYCAGQKVSVTNSLQTMLPDIAAQWHPTKNGLLTPEEITVGSNRSIWWKCDAGRDHIWQARMTDRKKGQGCPFCLNKKVSETNSLATLYPTAQNFWHPTKNGKLKPADFAAGSTKKVWWLCVKGSDHEWLAPVSNFKNGIGCPFCSGRKPSQTNSLLSLYPSVAAEWHPKKNGSLTPDKIVAGSHKKVWFQCSVNKAHVWQTTLKNRTTKKRPTACPHCIAK